MKYCTKCGKQLMDEAVICPGCGCAVEGTKFATRTVNRSTASVSSNTNGLQTAAKILMIIGTVLMGLYVIPLAWCIPMTVTYCNKIKNNEPIGTGFKVCCLLFVSLIAGILMLCDKDE